MHFRASVGKNTADQTSTFFLGLCGFLCQKVQKYIVTPCCPRMGSCPACTKFWQIRSFFRLFLLLLRATSSWTFHDGAQDLGPQPGPGPCTDYSRPTVAHFTDSTCMCGACVSACITTYTASYAGTFMMWNFLELFLGWLRFISRQPAAYQAPHWHRRHQWSSTTVEHSLNCAVQSVQ